MKIINREKTRINSYITRAGQWRDLSILEQGAEADIEIIKYTVSIFFFFIRVYEIQELAYALDIKEAFDRRGANAPREFKERLAVLKLAKEKYPEDFI